MIRIDIKIMKAYTDLEQSKKLAEILSIKSSDHHYVRTVTDFRGNPVDGEWSHPKYGNPNSRYANYIVQNFETYKTIPCWSLSALIEFTDECRMEKKPLGQTGEFTYSFVDDYYNIHTDEEDNPVDACYEMIIKLHELDAL